MSSQSPVRHPVFTLALFVATALLFAAETANACPEVVLDSQTGAAQMQNDLREALAAFDDNVVVAEAR